MSKIYVLFISILNKIKNVFSLTTICRPRTTLVNSTKKMEIESRLGWLIWTNRSTGEIPHSLDQVNTIIFFTFDNQGHELERAPIKSSIKMMSFFKWEFWGIKAEPIHKSAVFWYNLLRDGSCDYRTRHAACPVLIGQVNPRFIASHYKIYNF